MNVPTPFSAARWVLAGNVLQRVLAFAGLGIIARVLDDSAEGEAIFGAYEQLVALHFVVLAVLPLGLDQLVVREADQRPRYVAALRRVLWVAWGIAAAGLLVAHVPLSAALDLGERSHLLWLVPVVLLVQTAKWGIKPLLAAEFAFRRMTIAEFVNTVILMFGGAGLLLWRPEASSLYAAYALGEVAEVLLLWRGRGIGALVRPGATWAETRDLIRRHRRFCSVMTIDQGVNNFSNRSPSLLLGGLIGPGAVGLYGLANRLITAPINLLIAALGRVMLPALAGQNEQEIQRRVFLSLRLSSATIPPILLWIVFFAPEIVLVVLGSGWSDQAAPILQWLALNLVLQSLFSPVSVIDVLRDRPEVTLYWNVANLGVRAVALAGAAAAGMSVTGAIAVYAASSAVMWFVYGLLLAWLLRGGVLRFTWAWLRFLPLWALAGAGLWLARAAAGESVWIGVGLSVLPAFAYLALLRLYDREVFGLLLRLASLKRST